MSRHGKYVLLLAGILPATSCVDDPVTVVYEPDAGWADDLARQVQDDTTGNKYRARLAIAFDIEGELSPNTPITVHLEGVATEAIAGGTVQLALPTFSAMELAGPDKRPKYVPGGKAPVVASWQLPKMDAGDRWKQSVEIGSVAEKGYYQITAFTQTTGEALKSSYLFDNMFHQAWLLVIDGGGFATAVFDKSVFPTSIVPQPGPFEAWIGTGAGSSTNHAMTTANAVAAGSPPNAFHVYFFTEDANGNNIGMEGALVRADYIERGQLVHTINRIVPADGYVEFPCPVYREQRVWGTVKNTTTTEIYGGHHLASWRALYHQCGDTLDVQGARHYYLPWSYLEYAIPEIENHFGYYRSRVKFEYRDFDEDDDNPPSTYYSGRYDKIVYRAYYDRHWTSAHEFGHALHNEKLGGLWRAGCPSPHYVDRVSNYRCALQEGIADYAGDIGSPWPGYGGWENAHYTAPYHRGNGEIEGNVAALFHDLIDTNNEGKDRTTLRAVDVMTVFKTCINSDGRRNDVADFVWCLEDRVDTVRHRISFPGLAAPRRPTSIRPWSWNADDIRSTWTKNVG